MTRRCVTEQMVAAAMAQIESSGGKPSFRSVRAITKVGSKDTILEMMANVSADREADAAEAVNRRTEDLLARYPLEGLLAEKVETLAEALAALPLAIAEAQDQAERGQTEIHGRVVSDLKRRHAAEFGELQGRCDGLKADIQTKDVEITRLESNVEQLNKTLAKASAKSDDQQQEIMGLKAELKAQTGLQQQMQTWIAQIKNFPPVPENISPAAVPPAFERAAKRRSHENNGASKPRD